MGDNIAKNGRDLFRLKKKSKSIKENIIRDIKNHFESEEDY